MQFAKVFVVAVLANASVAFAQTHCAINEIQYAPLNGEPEWVELFNPTAQPVNLKNWKVRDMTPSKKTITTKDAVLAPGSYAVLAHDSTIVNFHASIPGTLVVFALPSLNNDSDAVIVYDAAGAVVDSVVYHKAWGGAGGLSIERVRTAAPPNDGANWRSSRDDEGSTPGRKNSVAPKPIDAALDSLRANPVGPNQFFLIAHAHNEGDLPIASAPIVFATDDNNDSLIEPVEIFFDTTFGALNAAGAQIVVQSPHFIGTRRVLAAMRVPGDGDTTNDRAAVTCVVTHAPRAVVINEIMYAPAAPEPEWVEIQNASPDTVDVSGWRISTGTSSGTVAHVPLLAPGEYCVIVRDTDALAGTRPEAMPRAVFAALPTLSNTGGKIILKDDLNEQIDSLTYRTGWGGAAGRSLERVDSSAASDDSSNWRESVDTAGATCGQRNSCARRRHDAGILAAAITDEKDSVRVRVKNFGLENALNVRVRAGIDSLGGDAPAEQPVVSLYSGGTADVTLPVAPLPIGENTITAIVDLVDDEQRANDTLQLRVPGALPRGALAINELMFAPRAGSAEYVELVNTSDQPANLLGVRLSGKPSSTTQKVDTVRLVPRAAILRPGAYACLAADTTIFRAFTQFPAGALVFASPKSAFTLNNDSDVVVIADAAGSMIDSVRYSSAWHSANVHTATGIALERVNPLLPSNDAKSWASSVDARGGTPAERNSVFTLLDVATGRVAAPVQATLTAAPNPFSPDGDGFEDLTIFHFALPWQTASYALRVFDATGRLVRTIVNGGRASRAADVVWDGRDDGGIALPIGIYIAVLDAVDAATGAPSRAVASVVVARRM